MTEPERGAPKGAPRGRAAADELVEVYKILVKAGTPLTVPEIAALMPKTGYGSWSQNAYRKHKEETDPVWLEGRGDKPWTPGMKKEAMVWWVRQIVKSGTHLKKFNVRERPKANASGIIQEGTVVPGNPPMVLRKEWVQKSTLVPWSLEAEAAITGGHGAGMEFRQWYESEFVGNSHKVAELRQKIELAYRAVCKDFQ